MHVKAMSIMRNNLIHFTVFEIVLELTGIYLGPKRCFLLFIQVLPDK